MPTEPHDLLPFSARDRERRLLLRLRQLERGAIMNRVTLLLSADGWEIVEKADTRPERLGTGPLPLPPPPLTLPGHT